MEKHFERLDFDRLDAANRLHVKLVIQAIVGDCATEECEHELNCPLEPVAVCTHCYEIGESASRYAWEESLDGCAWPCNTARTLGVTEEGER